jgi:DNA-binding NtrC family response regulator
MNLPRDSAASVLLVEDDLGLLAIMVECLLRAGFRVTTARDGAAALEAFQRAAFDVIVIDVFLPDAGGLGVVRAMTRRAPVRALFTSALSLPTVSEALRPAAVLFKPFKRQQLLDAVREVMGRPPLDLGRSGTASAPSWP